MFEQSDRIFAVIASGSTEFVQDGGFLSFVGL